NPVAGEATPELMNRPEAAPFERIAPTPNVSEPPTSVAGDFDENATLPATDEGADIVRPEGPAPSVLPSPDAAPAVAANSGATTDAPPLRPTMTRQRTSVTGSAPGVGTESPSVERVRPEIAGPR